MLPAIFSDIILPVKCSRAFHLESKIRVHSSPDPSDKLVQVFIVTLSSGGDVVLKYFF